MSEIHRTTPAETECISAAPVAGDRLLRQLRWRYATKVFDAERKIATEDWHSLEEALVPPIFRAATVEVCRHHESGG
jgi:hypothetical protein